MRNNEQRLEVEKLQNVEKLEEVETFQPTKNAQNIQTFAQLEFVRPTEFVELPSGGKFYPLEHPFCGKSEVEIYYATAKENDILTSQTLIEKGLIFDKLIESVLADKRCDSRDLLDADRMAILISVRKSGFSPDYKTTMNCPKCSNQTTVEVNLEKDVIVNENIENISGIEKTERNTFVLTLPRSKILVEFKFLTGFDENKLFENNKKRKKNKKHERYFTDRLKQMIISVNSNNSPSYIASFCENLSLLEANYLFEVYEKICPNVKIKTDFECECGNDGIVEVPITTDFFWPNKRV